METFNLELTREEIIILRTALMELPAKTSYQLLIKLDTQLSMQLKIKEKQAEESK